MAPSDMPGPDMFGTDLPGTDLPGAGVISGGMTGASVLIVGGGHNGLVAATYLARAGLPVTVLEAADRFGGAVQSARVFDGVDVSLSRFSYLVSLLPQQIVDELGLDLELRSRTIASYTPTRTGGLLVERTPGDATRESFHALTGGYEEWHNWQRLESFLERFARAIAPTLTEPLPAEHQLRAAYGDDQLWDALTRHPIGNLIEATLADDLVRGVVLTDALIGTFAPAHDTTLVQNRCFAYHVIGNATGEWKVPVGGMGRVASELQRVAVESGAVLRSGARVMKIEPITGGGWEIELAGGERLRSSHVLAGCAPYVLAGLRGRTAPKPQGSQTKINLVLRRLPRFASGIAPETGFAGTLHLHQGYERLQRAYEEASAGRIPDPLPAEVYCHTVTDDSILGAAPRFSGWHTLTMFALHTPAALFAADPARTREQVRQAALHSLQSVLAEPLEECLARDQHGRPCVEVMGPGDVEAATGMPGGHIFHGDLSWPWRADDAAPPTPAERWGVATPDDGILLCGSGSVRGGAVSGLGGHNAAHALLEMIR
ncbi:MAG TPA: NAD(P)/FAD-dependent oxidoreductase [Microlunatus sp.]|nr:NAD(P)/FAD-dependent oxidoreductase [Microlunatus sp.]